MDMKTSDKKKVPGIKVDEWTPLVKRALEDRFGVPDANRLYSLLKNTGSFVSGGFVLGACVGGFPFSTQERQDTDFYVPLSEIVKFNNGLVITKPPIFKADRFEIYAASRYCGSFLRENGIRQVYSFSQESKNGPPVKVDVMSVGKDRSLQEVVTNFDLTFCQVWFDGQNVYASHPDHIRNKTGNLNYKYCNKLIEGTSSGRFFLKKRLFKYRERGFQVEFDPDFVRETFRSVSQPPPTPYNYFSNRSRYKRYASGPMIDYREINLYDTDEISLFQMTNIETEESQPYEPRPKFSPNSNRLDNPFFECDSEQSVYIVPTDKYYLVYGKNESMRVLKRQLLKEKGAIYISDLNRVGIDMSEEKSRMHCGWTLPNNESVRLLLLNRFYLPSGRFPFVIPPHGEIPENSKLTITVLEAIPAVDF